MTSNLTALSLLIIGALGMLFIILRKAPVLASLTHEEIEKNRILNSIKKKIKDKTLKDFSSELLLHKLLSKTRVLVLKTEHKLSCWLSQLRQKSANKGCFPDKEYWKKLKDK